VTGILLTGRAGTGKTHDCLERLVATLPGRCLMLVPTYSQAEHLRYALLDRTRGLGQRVIHTFTSLAEHFGGSRLADLVPEPRRDRLAAEVLAGFFPEAAGQPGFRAEFLAAVKEIKEQSAPLIDALESARNQLPEEHHGRLLFEAAAVYSDRLAEFGLDHEDLLLRTREHFRSAAPELDLLLIDGFHDFTPVQKEIIDALIAKAGEAIVTLPLGASPVFQTAARTAESFAGLKRQQLDSNRRSAGTLAAIEEVLVGRETGGEGAREGVTVLAAASDEDEADRLARFVARSGRPPKDFLLVRRSFAGQHALYRAAFRRFGISLRFFGAEPLAAGPLGHALDVFLRTRFGAVSARELLPLLRSPYLTDPRPGEEVDAIARAIREEGERVDWSAFPGSAALLAEDARPLAEQLAGHFGIARALADVPDGDLELQRAVRLLQAAREEAMEGPVADAARHLLRRLPQLRAALPDRRRDCVYAVEAKEARQWEKRVVLVAGLDVATYPQPVRQDLFLRDDERRALAERGLSLPLREKREDDERYLFYVVLTRASEEMVLSWAAFDEEGTPVPESPFLKDLLVRLPGLKPRRVQLAEQFVPADDAVQRSDLLPILADGLARVDRGEGALAASLYDRGAVDRSLLAWPRRLELLRTRPIRDLPVDPARKLSASSIKTYQRCPYLFLAQKVLRVRPEREAALDGMLRGQIVHRVLELVAEGADSKAMFEEVAAEMTAHLQFDLAAYAEWRRMRDQIQRGVDTLRDAQVKAVEEGFEIWFDDVLLRGRIDRIDRVGDGDLVRDYKTGQVGAADDVQLDTYLLAVENPIGAVFDILRNGTQRGFVLEDAPGKFPRLVQRITREELHERREAMAQLVKDLAGSIRAGRLAVHPADPDRCTRTQCEGFDLCRVARNHWFQRSERAERAEREDDA